MPVTLFPGSNNSVLLILCILLMIQTSLMFKTHELKYEIKRNQKEYSLVLDELERKNKLAIEGIK